MKFSINVTDAPFNATGNGVTDDSAAIQQAINYVCQTGQKSIIHFPAGNYLLNSGISISNAASIQLVGEGSFGGTTLLYGGASGDVVTFSNCQHSSLQCMNIQYAENNTATNGNAVTLDGNCFQVHLFDVRMDYCYNGVWIKHATESRLNKIQFRYMLGNYGVQFGGTSGCYRAVLDDIIADNPYPLTCPAQASIGNWMPGKTYAAGDVVLSNGCIYQCVTAGTSSTGTGPSGNGGGLRLPQTSIADGTAAWVFVSNRITWIAQESNGYSLVISKAALVDGYIGYRMSNTLAPANPPMWVMAYDMECDHNYHTNIQLEDGQGAYITTSWFGSCLTGNAVNIVPPFLGQVSITNSRISFAAQNGILIGAHGSPVNPADILLQNNFIGGNSQQKAKQYNGIVSVADGLTVNGNRIGTDIAAPGVITQYAGVFIMEGSDKTVVTSNNLFSNQFPLVNNQQSPSVLISNLV